MSEHVIPIGDLNDMLRDKDIPAFDFNNPQQDPVKLAKDLIKTMQSGNGIGLAANQIGIRLKVFCMQTDPPMVCFNPRITWQSEETVKLEEGCLSYPGVIIKIERPQHIRVRFQDPYGTPIVKKFTGMAARCFLHEYDHLQGKLYYERADWFQKEKFEKRWKIAKRRLRKIAKLKR